MSGPIRIAITSGDSDGIGMEVISKALSKIKPKRGVQFFLWRPLRGHRQSLRRIDSCFSRITVKTLAEGLGLNRFDHKEIVDISSSCLPSHWVLEAARSCKHLTLDALVTAPMSKALPDQSLFKGQVGHTEILRKVCGKKDVFMAFVGNKFNVLLATGHIPLKKVSNALTPGVIESSIKAAEIISQLDDRLKNRKIAVLGLNPHAGENGVIGTEELETINKVIKKINSKTKKIEGPIVPDSAFFSENWKKYSCYVALYHDQGLIPFKTIHGQDSGIHITIGLPFIRTSVDHGTAKNIFGKNIANPNSMIEAIKAAIRLTKDGVHTKFQ